MTICNEDHNYTSKYSTSIYRAATINDEFCPRGRRVSPELGELVKRDWKKERIRSIPLAPARLDFFITFWGGNFVRIRRLYV